MVEKLTNEKINMYPQLGNVMDYNLDSTRLRKQKTILLLKCVKEEQWVKHLIDKMQRLIVPIRLYYFYQQKNF